jgi:hypothetical protein
MAIKANDQAVTALNYCADCYWTGSVTMRRFIFVAFIAVATIAVGSVSALAGQQSLAKDVRFCPSWAEAHERTLTSLNNGRPPYPVKWKGCILLKQGTMVDVIDHDDQWTEIVINGKHWFADE